MSSPELFSCVVPVVQVKGIVPSVESPNRYRGLLTANSDDWPQGTQLFLESSLGSASSCRLLRRNPPVLLHRNTRQYRIRTVSTSNNFLPFLDADPSHHLCVPLLRPW